MIGVLDPYRRSGHGRPKKARGGTGRPVLEDPPRNVAVVSVDLHSPALARLDHPRAVGAEQRTEADLHRPPSDMCDYPAMRNGTY
jgi:hypothetical protein